jgi:hypothetical protein
VSFNSFNTTGGTPGAPAVAAGNCSVASANSANSYYTTQQETWSTGVNLSALGLDLSAQDGWTTSAELTFKFTSQGGAVCGVSNYPNANNPSAGYLQTH